MIVWSLDNRFVLAAIMGTCFLDYLDQERLILCLVVEIANSVLSFRISLHIRFQYF